MVGTKVACTAGAFAERTLLIPTFHSQVIDTPPPVLSGASIYSPTSVIGSLFARESESKHCNRSFLRSKQQGCHHTDGDIYRLDDCRATMLGTLVPVLSRYLDPSDSRTACSAIQHP